METVRIYYMDLSSLAGKEQLLWSVLPADRLEKAAKFVREEDRLRSLAGGYLIRKIVGDSFTDENGKPRAKDCHFSLSHSGNTAALAVSTSHDVGIDVEAAVRDRDEEKVARSCLSGPDLEAYLNGTPFLSLFTAKESLSKAEGHGLTEPEIIPSLPLDGKVTYKSTVYYRHSLALNGCFASVTLEGGDFNTHTEELYVS